MSIFSMIQYKCKNDNLNVLINSEIKGCRGDHFLLHAKKFTYCIVVFFTHSRYVFTLCKYKYYCIFLKYLPLRCENLMSISLSS
jgi:hypothetical protein